MPRVNLQKEKKKKKKKGTWHCFQIDICNTMSLNRRMHHHGSNGSMSVALRQKFQSDPRCNLAVRKSDEHEKHPLCSPIQKFIRYYTSLQSSRREKQRVENESTSLAKQREKVVRREGRNTKLDIIYLVFCCSSCMHISLTPFSQLCGLCGTPLWSSFKMAAVIFGRFYIIASRL